MNAMRREGLARIVVGVLVLGGCAGPKTGVSPPPRGLVGVRQIELGSRLFQPDSARLAPSAPELIARAMADVPDGSRLRIEVFADGRGRSSHAPRGGADRRSREQAETMRVVLKRMGFNPVLSVGRGLATVDGRPADGRIEVFVLR